MYLRRVTVGMSHPAVFVTEGESGASQLGCNMALAIPPADEKCNTMALLLLLALVHQQKVVWSHTYIVQLLTAAHKGG